MQAKEIRFALKASCTIISLDGIDDNHLTNLCYAVSTKAKHLPEYADNVLTQLHAAQSKAISRAKRNGTSQKEELEKWVTKTLEDLTIRLEGRDSL